MAVLWLSIICISFLSNRVQATNTTSNATSSGTGPDFISDCDTEKMTIYIRKDKISIPESDLSQYNISWNDPNCGPSESTNDTHLVLVAGYSSCGTQAVTEGDHVIFKNKVSINLNKTNSYKNDLLERIDTFATYSVECNVPQGVNVTQENGVNITKADLIEGVSSSTDQFTVSMNLHSDSEFAGSLGYPAVIDTLGRFNLELEIDTVANLYIIPRNCYGTSTSNRDDAIREALVTDGCPNQDHVFKVETKADDGKKFQFSLNVFRFKNSNGMVYIHCSAHVCLTGSNDTNCQFGCQGNTRRRRRSVEDNALTQLDLTKDYDIRTGLIIVTESSRNNDSSQQDTKESQSSDNDQFFQTTTNIILIALISVMFIFVCSVMVIFCVRRHRSDSRKDVTMEMR
ncbi:ZP domain-containing protein-like [Clytia hemisphaerica]